MWSSLPTRTRYTAYEPSEIWPVIFALLLQLQQVFASNLNWEKVGFRSRAKGQVACYSCIATSSTNLTGLLNVFERSGMELPILVENCDETGPASNPNFAGANVHFCSNTPGKPGACVKLRGYHDGQLYIYRECWSRMWTAQRIYHSRLSERCYSDSVVQSFVDTQKNTICFCEDDLCNYAYTIPVQLLSALIVFYVIVLF